MAPVFPELLDYFEDRVTMQILVDGDFKTEENGGNSEQGRYRTAHMFIKTGF